LDCFIGVLPSYLRRQGIDEEIAFDATSRAWEKARKWIVNGRAASMTSGERRRYLCQTAVNQAKELYRRRRIGPLGRSRPVLEADDSTDPFAHFDPLGKEKLAAQLALLPSTLNKLEGDARALLELYYFDEASYAQLADVLGVSVATAARRIAEACMNLGDLFWQSWSEFLREERQQNDEKVEFGAHFYC
jgi:RNA polymerase sigma factor (sigma-70 family)